MCKWAEGLSLVSPYPTQYQLDLPLHLVWLELAHSFRIKQPRGFVKSNVLSMVSNLFIDSLLVSVAMTLVERKSVTAGKLCNIYILLP